jgi:hypothetical protein
LPEEMIEIAGIGHIPSYAGHVSSDVL